MEMTLGELKAKIAADANLPDPSVLGEPNIRVAHPTTLAAIFLGVWILAVLSCCGFTAVVWL